MAGEGTENANADNPEKGDVVDAGKDTQKTAAADKGDKGSTLDAGKVNPLLELVGDDADTREWLTKNAERVKDVPSALKLAREQDKMIGEQAKKLGDATKDMVRIPGKDATPEEIKAYKEKLGIPETPEGYEFKAPKDLPEGLPYDGERAKSFAAEAARIGLTKAQAQAVHDWGAANAVGDFTMSKEQSDAKAVETAKAETAKLNKLWGPLDGQTFKANAAFADKALMEIGGQEALAEFQRVGLIGDAAGQKIIQSAAIATMLAKVGQTLYKEDEVLRGDPSKLNNPFQAGPSENITAQMQMIKQNRQQALSFIAAAGKKPSDFGLTE
jgi:hypothetical protein